MRIYVILFFLLFINACAPENNNRQQDGSSEINIAHSCNYFGEVQEDKLYEFSSSGEARQIIGDIMSAIGLRPKFEVKAANVGNAAAVIYGNKRYILYSQNFVSQVNQSTGTKWAAASILAHEIGHHLNGHTLENGGSRPPSELEADEFSGFVMRKMGATLQEAQAAMNLIADKRGSSTHPPRSARLEAIAVGWQMAGEQGASTGGNKKTETSTQKKPEVKIPQNPKKETPSKRSEPEPALAKQYIAQNVFFSADPNTRYYLTIKNNLVKEVGKNIEIVGKLSESNKAKYPYMIYDSYFNYLYVDNKGNIYNGNGSKVGYMKKP